MIDATQYTQPLSTFVDHPADLLHQLKPTHRPITLTVDGKPEAIFQDPAEYQRLLDLAALADAREGIREGLEDVAAGRIRPARMVFAELREEYAISR